MLHDETILPVMTITLLLNSRQSVLSSAVYNYVELHVVCCEELKLNSNMNSGLNLFARHKGWLAGCHLSYDTCRSSMTNFNMAAARTMSDYTIYLAL